MSGLNADALLAKYDDLGQVAQDLRRLGDEVARSKVYRESFGWEAFREKLDVKEEAIRERRFRLAFAGGFSVGKSYLVSAFLGKPGLLPSLLKPTTGVVCIVRRGRRSFMEVTYWSRTESDDMQRFYLNELGIPKTVPVSEGAQAAEELRPSLPGDKRRLVDEYLSFRASHERFGSKLGTTEEVSVQEVAPEHRASPSVSDYPHLNYLIKVDDSEGTPNHDLLRTIKQVVMYVDTPYLTETVEIVDLPGAGATDAIDGFIQRHFLHQADGVVVVTAANAPFGADENTVVEILRDNHDSLQDRVFVAVTQFDRLAGPELDKARLEREYKSLQRKLREDARLPAAGMYYLSPFVSQIAELEAKGDTLDPNDKSALERARQWIPPQTGNAELDHLLGIYRQDGGLAEFRTMLLEQFRTTMVALKVRTIARGLQNLTQLLESTYRQRWETAIRDQTKEGARRVKQAMRFLRGSKENFARRSERFRREQVQKQTFDEVFQAVLTQVDERIKLHLEGCTQEQLRYQYDRLGSGREPHELLTRFREATEPVLLEEFSELVWDRAPRSGLGTDEDDDDDLGLEEEPEVRAVPALSGEVTGRLRRHVRDRYYEAIEREDLQALVRGLLPNSPEERRGFVRVFEELDLTLEVTTRNFILREALELNDSKELDDLAQGAAQFPADWDKRYARDYAVAFLKRLERYCRSLRGYLWNLYFKHLEEAEERVVQFLGSEDLQALVSVNLDDIEIPGQGGPLGGSGQLMDHFERWKTIDAAVTTLAREVSA